jgi:hypothetical protein
MLVRLVVGAFSDSNATAITLSSFLKDDRWPDFPRAAQCADATSLTEIKEALRKRMHVPIPEVGRWLAQVVAGYFAYHAVPTNSAALYAFRYHVAVLWHRQLCRRSQRAYVVWERMAKLADEFLPKPRILHPWPSVRFAVRHPR